MLLPSLLRASAGTGFIFMMSLMGSALVFFMTKEVNPRLRALIMGFAAGIMSAAAVWSLLLPAIEQVEQAGRLPGWFPAGTGLLMGGLFLGLADTFIERRSRDSAAIQTDSLLFTAITLHNIPEGMAVGLAFAMAGDGEAITAAAALAFGIGIQNFPEGAAISLPLRQLGFSRRRSFAMGALSGSVEPVFGIMAVTAAGWVRPVMPWLLSFAAGAMLYVSANELIPDSRGRLGSMSYISGFMLMMMLDVALG